METYKEVNNNSPRRCVARCVKIMSDAVKKKAKQRWAIEKPKFDNASQLKGDTCFVEPNNEEFKLHNQSRSWKVGSSDASKGAVHKHHQDHIIEKGMNSQNLSKNVHKFIPMPQVMKIPNAKAAVLK